VAKQPTTLKLDQVDFDILETLQKDARISNKELARISGVSPSTCLERVRRLKEHRVLTRFHAEVDREAMGGFANKSTSTLTTSSKKLDNWKKSLAFTCWPARLTFWSTWRFGTSSSCANWLLTHLTCEMKLLSWKRH